MATVGVKGLSRQMFKNSDSLYHGPGRAEDGFMEGEGGGVGVLNSLSLIQPPLI